MELWLRFARGSVVLPRCRGARHLERPAANMTNVEGFRPFKMSGAVGLGVLAGPVLSDVPRVGKYELRQLLKRGGMGALYLGYDPELEREVAIKLLREDLESDSCRERFVREARAVARLRHPNIVTIFDFGVHEDQQYIVMEYIPGDTIADLIRRRTPLPLTRKLELIEGVCRGLAHAHRAHIIHRDIKPANLMVDVDGTIKVLDFGIAKTAATTLTQEGALIGTINYMSPEQLQTGRVDQRSDIFAVGAVLYELVSYAQAFEGHVPDGIISKILYTDPVPLSTRCPDIDPGIGAIAARALHKNPDDRYQDLSALGAALAAVRLRRPSLSIAPPTLALRSWRASARQASKVPKASQVEASQVEEAPDATTQKIVFTNRKVVPERRRWLNAGLAVLVVTFLGVSVWSIVVRPTSVDTTPPDPPLLSRPLNDVVSFSPVPRTIDPFANEVPAPRSTMLKPAPQSTETIVEKPAGKVAVAPPPVAGRPTAPGVLPLPPGPQPTPANVEESVTAEPQSQSAPTNIASEPPRPQSPTPTDEQQIRALIARYIGAMSARSIEQIEEVFVLTPSTRASLTETFRRISSQRIDVLGVPTIQISERTASAGGTLRYEIDTEGRRQRRDFRTIFNFQKRSEGWKIVMVSQR
jgi:serine/threonine protein kinase